MSAIVAETVTVQLRGRPVLHEVSLTLHQGLTVIIGPNGAGKSTLLRTLAGLAAVSGGTIRLDGRNLRDWSRAKRAQRMGYLPQHHVAAWAMPVRDIVGLGRMPWSDDAASSDAAILAAMAAVDVADLADRPLNQLSGGERSRVMLARLLAGQHDILLCDEPLSHADPRHQWQMMAALQAMAAAGKTVCVVMHDLALAARFATRLIVMQTGRIVADGAPGTVLTGTLIETVFGIGSLIEQRDGQWLIMPWG